jgi:hypothetical protein
MMYKINPHLEGRDDVAPSDEAFPMLSGDVETKVFRDDNGDVIVYTRLVNSADILHEINAFLINEERAPVRVTRKGERDL